MTRFIPFQRYDPYYKTGLNQVLMESVRESGQRITLLAGWKKKCVNLGYNQNFKEEIEVEEFDKREDVILVRRQGGGGATYLTPEGEITWGIIGREKEFPKDINRIYEKVCGKIAKGLTQIGIQAEYEPVNDIVTSQGKISGATMKRKDKVVYVGGTLIYKTDPEEMFQLLTPNEEKKKDKQIEDYAQRVTSVSEESKASFKKSKEALKHGLLDGQEYENSEIKKSEHKRAKKLSDKYSDKKWLYRQ